MILNLTKNVANNHNFNWTKKTTVVPFSVSEMHESDAETNNIPLSSLACFLHDVKCWHVQRESESDSYDFHKTSKLPNAKFVKLEMK